MKETTKTKNKNRSSRQEVCLGAFTAAREYYRPSRPVMFEVKFTQCTGGFLEHGLTIVEGLTQERAVALAECLNRAVGLELSGPS